MDKGAYEGVDALMVTVITDNYYDTLRPDTAVAQRARVAPGLSIHAEHGLAFFIETVIDGKSHSFMFDYGLDFQGIRGNLEFLGLDPATVTAFGLSHGHFDHWGGLTDLLKYFRPGIRRGTPLYVGGEAFARRFVMYPQDPEPHDIGQLSREEIEALDAVRVIEIREPARVMEGLAMTGNIERVTEYEKCAASLLIERGHGLEADPFTGEQALVCIVKGKGLVVISGCAHAGIMNTVTHARKITGVEKVHALIGGFHLVNADSRVIERTVRDMAEMNPDYVIPTHCTGFEATALIAREMKDRFILSTAGTKYTFPSG